LPFQKLKDKHPALRYLKILKKGVTQPLGDTPLYLLFIDLGIDYPPAISNRKIFASTAPVSSSTST